MASSAATGGIVEHAIQMPGVPATGGESQQRESDTAVPPPAVAADGADAAADDSESQPEKKLNLFVRVLATGELVGNALGTLASLWATFVLLGGYRSTLDQVDFWIATAMVFLEAFRVFIRNFKLDSQSLFGSTKAFRRIYSSFARLLFEPQEGDEVVLIVGVVMAMFAPLVNLSVLIGSIIQLAVLTLMSRTPLTETIMRQLHGGHPSLRPYTVREPTALGTPLHRRRPKQLWLWVLLIFPLVHAIATQVLRAFRPPILKGLRPLLLDSLGTLTQAVAVLLLYFRPEKIETLTRDPWGRDLLYVSKVISTLLLVPLAMAMVISPGLFSAISTVVLLLGSLQDPKVPNRQFSELIDSVMHLFFLFYLVFPLPLHFGLLGVVISLIVFLVVLLIGNLQIPATVAQIVLSSWRLANPYGDDKNMVASIRVFYALVLCQGSLYILACILALFSAVPRRSLARRSGFWGDWGSRAVDLYYERAYTKRIEIGVFAEDTISLASFVVDSLNSASSISRELHLSASSTRELQLVGVRVLHTLLQQRCSSNEELVSVITRSEKAVPTLINMLGWTLEQDEGIRLFAAKATADLSSYLRIAGIVGAVRLVSSLLDVENQPPSKNNKGDDEHGGNCCQRWCPWVCRCWQCMKKNWPWRPMEEKSINSPQDSLPVLGMMILERLACDPDNCTEIMKNKNLIPKIIDLISYTSNDESINLIIISSSLNLVRRIATTHNGKVGATLRQELWESPFLLTNLTSILEGSPQLWKPAIDVIATLALDEGARHGLGSVQVIIHKLLDIFIIGRDESTNYEYDQSLRVAAGGALANLAMESPENCFAILDGPQGYRYDLVKDLEGMLRNDEYSRSVAASLLQNLCECSRTRDGLPTVQTYAACSRIKDWLSDARVSNQLSSALQVVLQKIMAAEGKQLEALIGLASQICYVLTPQPFVQGLESHIIGAPLVQKLVNTLKSNKKPSHEYPRMRRVIVDMVISVLRRYPGYAIIFRTEEMIDELSKVETNPSKVEKYRVFLGKEGVVLEHDLPLRELAATAKGLIIVQLQHKVLKKLK